MRSAAVLLSNLRSIGARPQGRVRRLRQRDIEGAPAARTARTVGALSFGCCRSQAGDAAVGGAARSTRQAESRRRVRRNDAALTSRLARPTIRGEGNWKSVSAASSTIATTRRSKTRACAGASAGAPARSSIRYPRRRTWSKAIWPHVRDDDWCGEWVAMKRKLDASSADPMNLLMQSAAAPIRTSTVPVGSLMTPAAPARAVRAHRDSKRLSCIRVVRFVRDAAVLVAVRVVTRIGRDAGSAARHRARSSRGLMRLRCRRSIVQSRSHRVDHLTFR